MSLLMDALRKAEDAKRLAAEPAATELTLAPMTAPAAASPLPDLAQHIDALDSDLSAVAGNAAPARRAPAAAPIRPPESGTADRSAARNVFAAKAMPGSRRGLWSLLALCAIAALGFGAYFWWQLQSVAGGLRPLPTPPQTPAAAVPALLAAAPPFIPAAATMPPAALAPAPRAAPTAAPRAEPRLRSPGQAPDTSPPASDRALRLSKSRPPPGRTIERAYDALQAGRFDEAQAGYEQVLRGDAKSTDALLGLATIAARQGQAELAQGYYLRALEADPNDATAQAGLINSRGQADPGQSESRLKSALASQPESSALHFALGNLYARQARWSEAQQAYFLAYSGEPDNADIIFNLAVSLDQLHQNRLAAQYYQMALDAAEGQNGSRHGSFDRNQVKQRLADLQP